MTNDIQVVAFDAYGTLCDIADLPEFLADIGPLAPEEVADITERVRREVVSVRLFDDVLETLDALRLPSCYSGHTVVSVVPSLDELRGL
jgi:FMN phosphatase YigB (HAD superfamily)